MSAPAAARRPAGFGIRAILVWAALSAAGAALCWFLRGPGAVEAGFDSFVDQMIVLMPRLVAGLLVSGFTQILVPRDVITAWLGDKSGFRGILTATAVGAIAPGGPMVAFPLVLVLRNGGASASSLVAFMTSWVTLSVNRVITWELSLMGPDIALVRYLASLTLAIVAGLLAVPLARVFGYESRSAA